MRAKKSENFTSYGFSFDLHRCLMEGTDDKLSGCIFEERYTGVAGGHGKAAAKKAAAAKRAAGSAAAKAKRCRQGKARGCRATRARRWCFLLRAQMVLPP